MGSMNGADGARPWTRVGAAAVVGLLAIGTLGSCAASKNDSTAASAPAGAVANGAAPQAALGAPALGGGGAGAGDSSAQGASFKVDAYDQTPVQGVGSFISTATMTVKVDDVGQAKPKVVAATQAASGGLFGEKTTFGDTATSVITVKVPPEKFAQLLNDLAQLGTLAAEEVKTDDVTNQVVDLDARIHAASSSLDRTRALLDQAKSLTEISQLENEVSRRQADLESLKGQQAALQAKVALATIVITLESNGSTPAVEKARLDAEEAQRKANEAKPLPGFSDGLSGGLTVAGNVGSVVLAVLGALVPFLPLVVVALVIVHLLRRRTRAAATPGAVPAGAAGREAN